MDNIDNLIKYTGFIVNINKWKSNIFVSSAKLPLITNARNQQQLQFIFIVSLVYIYIISHKLQLWMKRAETSERGSKYVVWNRMQINSNVIVESSLVKHPILQILLLNWSASFS